MTVTFKHLDPSKEDIVVSDITDIYGVIEAFCEVMEKPDMIRSYEIKKESYTGVTTYISLHTFIFIMFNNPQKAWRQITQKLNDRYPEHFLDGGLKFTERYFIDYKYSDKHNNVKFGHIYCSTVEEIEHCYQVITKDGPCVIYWNIYDSQTNTIPDFRQLLDEWHAHKKIVNTPTVFSYDFKGWTSDEIIRLAKAFKQIKEPNMEDFNKQFCSFVVDFME